MKNSARSKKLMLGILSIGFLLISSNQYALAQTLNNTESTGSINASNNSDGTNNTLSDDEVSNVRREMALREIPNDKQELILQKLNRGELPDSDQPGSSPISVESHPNNSNIEVLTFADGSVAYTSIGDSSTSPYRERGVGSEGCNRYWYNSGWERWDSCLIRYSGIAFNYSFRADISLPHSPNGRGVIRRVWEPTVWRSWGHTVQSTSVSIIQSWENKQNGTPARAQMRATLQVVKIFSTKTLALNLEIRGRSVRIFEQM